VQIGCVWDGGGRACVRSEGGSEGGSGGYRIPSTSALAAHLAEVVAHAAARTDKPVAVGALTCGDRHHWEHARYSAR
jgi:hypothetical protein